MIVKLYSPIGPPGVRLDGLIYYFAGGVGMPNGPVWALLAGLKLQYWDGAAWQDFFPAVSDSQLSANVVILTAGVYPAGDGSLITGVPPAAQGNRGTAAGGTSTFDGGGQKVLTAGVEFPDCQGASGSFAFVACQTNGVGTVFCSPGGFGPGASVTIQSSAGALDAGLQFNFVVSYL